MFSLNNIPRDHLFTIFSFCSTPSLGNLAKVCKDLETNVKEYLKIRYSSEKIAFFKENHKIKKVILKKIELNSFPEMRSFIFKMPFKFKDIAPHFFFGKGDDFFIFYDGKIKLIDLKKETKKDIKIRVKKSVVFNSSIKKSFLLENSLLINKTKSDLLLKDTVLNIHAIFSLATKTIQFASFEEVLFQEADVVILYNKSEVIIVKKNEIKLSIEFSNLKIKDFKNGILILGSENGRLIGVDVNSNQILFDKKFNHIYQFKIIENNKFVIQTDDHETSVCECKTAKIIFTFDLCLQENVLFDSDKFIGCRTPTRYRDFFVADVINGIPYFLKNGTSTLQSMHSISNNRLIVKHDFDFSIGSSAVSIHDFSTLRVVATHYFQSEYISISPINPNFYLIASTDAYTHEHFFSREFNFFYGILQLDSGKYYQLHNDCDWRTFRSQIEASSKYIAECAYEWVRSKKLFGNHRHEIGFKITIFSLMEDSLKNK